MKTDTWLTLLVCACCSASLQAQEPSPTLPAGYVVAQGSESPDGHYAVSAYDDTVNAMPADWEYAPNKVLDLKADTIVGNIHGVDAATHMPHGDILPCRWSADSSLLLWEVTGKWCPWALNLMRLREAKIVWQVNLLLEAQRLILARTRRADPKGYRAVMKENKEQASPLGSGISVYPDGFTIDVSTDASEDRSLTLPFTITASLTANPKGLDPYPTAANVNALMVATVEEGGRLRVLSFRLTKKPSAPFARVPAPNHALQRTLASSRR